MSTSSDSRTQAGSQAPVSIAPPSPARYAPPELKRYGDIAELTQANFSGFDRMLYGGLFAMTSSLDDMPDAPGQW